MQEEKRRGPTILERVRASLQTASPWPCRRSARNTRINNVLTSSTRGWIGGARACQKYRYCVAHRPLQIRGPDRWNTGSASTFTVQSSHGTSPPSTVPAGVLSNNCLPKSPLHTSSRDEKSSTWSHFFLRHWSMRIALNALQASPAAFLRRRRTRVHAFTRITRSHATMTTGVFRVRMSFSAIKDNCCARPFFTSQFRPPCAISCSPRGLTR